MADILYADAAKAAKDARVRKEHGVEEAPDSLLSRWYLFRLGRFWSVANILCALAVGSLSLEVVGHAIVTSWVVFVVLNSLLFMYILSDKSSHGINTAPARPKPTLFFAAVLGSAWGAILFLTAPHLEATLMLKLQLIVIVISAAAIPTLALQEGAFTTYALALLVPTVAKAPPAEGVATFDLFYSALFLIYLTAAYFASVQRPLASILEKYSGLGRLPPPKDTVLSDIRQYPDILDKRYRKISRALPGQYRAKSSLDAVGDGIITTNKAGLVEYLNPIAEVMTGMTKSNALGSAIDTILRLRCTETNEPISSALDTLSDNHTTQVKRRATLIRQDGIEYQLEVIVVPLSDESEFCDGASFILREISEHNSLAKEVRWRATHDPLTKLINRIEFERRLRKLFQQSNEADDKRHAVCVLDLDKFQYINETFGHQYGDKFLVALGDEFKSKIRGADTLARMGDNKFAALFYNCTSDKARMIAEGLRRIAEETTIDADGNDVNITISAGVVEFSPASDSVTDVLIAADSACTNAKKEGGNRVFTVIEGETSSRAIGENIEHIRGIQNALRDNQLSLYIQTVRANASQHFSQAPESRHCEILLRMTDSEGKVSAPRELLATAERFQIMPELDRWATKASLDAIRLGHPALAEMETIFITISGQSLNDDKFLDYLISELEDEHLPAERLCFEISHASLISSIDRASFFVANLKEYGCQIALNDFGFAMHAFELLKRLQIDYLKIDAQFTRNMAHNSVDYEIVLALSRIAKTLRIKTIAEGVSTVALQEAMEGMGIDFVQGLLIDEAKPIESKPNNLS